VCELVDSVVVEEMPVLGEWRSDSLNGRTTIENSIEEPSPPVGAIVSPDGIEDPRGKLRVIKHGHREASSRGFGNTGCSTRLNGSATGTAS
jgi:hypothetical protein